MWTLFQQIAARSFLFIVYLNSILYLTAMTRPHVLKSRY